MKAITIKCPFWKQCVPRGGALVPRVDGHRDALRARAVHAARAHTREAGRRRVQAAQVARLYTHIHAHACTPNHTQTRCLCTCLHTHTHTHTHTHSHTHSLTHSLTGLSGSLASAPGRKVQETPKDRSLTPKHGCLTHTSARPHLAWRHPPAPPALGNEKMEEK